MRTEQIETIPVATKEDRFVALLDEHRKIVFKVANLYCRNEADFGDIVQEVVLQAWRSFDRYDESRRFSTWLYAVALNVAISFCRGEARRSRRLVPADESIIEIVAPQSQITVLEDQLHLLRGLIDHLNDLDKALVLLYLDENSYGAIGEILGISESNVGTRINRIKQKLQRAWAGESKKVHSNGIQ